MSILPGFLALGLAAGMARISPVWKRRKRRHHEDERTCPDCADCPLSSLGVGQACCLLHVGAGRRLRRRLADLGLTPGVQLTVLQNTGGPVMICVRNSRLALGRDMAGKLNVRPITGQEISE